MDLEKNIGAGAGGLAPGDPGGAALAAAQALVAAYDSGCTVPLQSGTAFYNAVHNFKTAFNIWTSGGTSGPNGDGSPCAGCLNHNGLYDQACVDAVNSIPGAPAAPPACTGAAPQPQPVPQPQPAPPVAPSGGLPGWAKLLLWLLVAGGVVAGAIWLYRYYGKRQLAAAEGKRKRRRGRRKKR